LANADNYFYYSNFFPVIMVFVGFYWFLKDRLRLEADEL